RWPQRVRPAPPPWCGALRAAATGRPRRRPRGACRRHAADHGRHRRALMLKKTWGGRFTTGADPTAERFTASLEFDRRLWSHDITGSIAWARALARAGLVTDAERDAMLEGLARVREELERGAFTFRPELEDIHTNIERRLIDLAGPVGGKLHTGRSRNDQIALDERLYLREILTSLR